jgi:excisionase family DNA binding protein
MKEFLTIQELSNILGLSRIAVYKKVKKGEIPAERAGKAYLIPATYIADILGDEVSQTSKDEIHAAVKRTVQQYGEVLKMLGKE